MQAADLAASKAPATPSPGDGWRWSAKLSKWVQPGASTATGCVPPEAHRFKTGDENPSKAGILSADARRKIRESAKRLDTLTESWLNQAELGNMKALSMLLDRLEGPVEQQVRATIESRYVIEEVGVPYVDVPQPVVVSALSAPASSLDAPEPAAMRIGSDTQAVAADALTVTASANECSVTLEDAGVRSIKKGDAATDPDGGVPEPPAGVPTPVSAPAHAEQSDGTRPPEKIPGTGE